MTQRKLMGLAGGIAIGFLLLAAGIVAAQRASNESPKRGLVVEATTVTNTTVFDPATQYLSFCGAVVTPPAAAWCDATVHTLRFIFWDSMVNATVFTTWQKQNPGEWARLQAHMATPVCSNGPSGQPQDMVTAFGAALYAEVSAYNCAQGTESIVLPAPNPPPTPGAKDRKPPTAPGPIQVATP